MKSKNLWSAVTSAKRFIRRVLDLMMGFIAPYTFSQTAAIAELHTLQFTVTDTQGFSVFGSRIPATDFTSLTITTTHV